MNHANRKSERATALLIEAQLANGKTADACRTADAATKTSAPHVISLVEAVRDARAACATARSN